MRKITQLNTLIFALLLASCVSVPDTAEIRRLGVLSITSDRALVGIYSGERLIKGYPVDISTWKINDVLTTEVIGRVAMIEWVDLRKELSAKVKVPTNRYVDAKLYRDDISTLKQKYNLDGILIVSNRVTSRGELAKYREYGYMPSKDVFECSPHTFATISIQYLDLSDTFKEFRRTELHKTCLEQPLQVKSDYSGSDLTPLREPIEQDSLFALREGLGYFFPEHYVRTAAHAQ